jgi:LuxR family transcriptional regulator, maltose regulon positive regulatory protein
VLDLAHAELITPTRDRSRTGLVARGGLYGVLSAVPPGQVVLVCAPAGSGKTILLRSWVEAEGLRNRVAWVSVARGERDGQRFWLSLIDELVAAVGEDGPVERVAATPAFDGCCSTLNRCRSPSCWSSTICTS